MSSDLSSYARFDPPLLGHLGMRPELVVPDATDERIWVPLDENVWTRPLYFDMNSGGHCEVLRVRRGGVLGRHRHPSPVHGFVLKGRWRYLEHSWSADTGSYVFETPGEVHTLTVDDDDEMQTFFYVGGPTLYVNEQDEVILVEDNFQLIELARDHYAQVGLGADFVNQFIR
jgi:2,4'-dihydroxyacetophenone dioxygenase